MVASAVVMVLVCWCPVVVGYIEEDAVGKHPGADSFHELLGLFSDVCQGCIGAPSADEHDGVDWFFCQEHPHCD